MPEQLGYVQNFDDNADLWQRVVGWAAKMGALHAALGEHAMTETQVINAVGAQFGKVRYRRFHSRLLRAAYGAGYGGIKKSQECKAKGW